MTFWYVPSTYRGRRFGRGIRGYGRLAGGSLSGGVGLISVTDPVEAMENVETAAPPEEAAKIAEAEATGKPVVVKKETASALGNFARGAWNFAKKAAANPYVRTGAIVGATLLANHFGPGLMTKGYKLGKAAAYKMGNVLYNRLDNVYRDKPLYDIYEKDGKKYYKVAKQVTGATLGGETKRLAKDTGAFLFNKLNDFSGNRLLNGVSAVSRGWNTMKGWFSRGSGYGGYYGGRRGRFVKGSPEAKAYMAMLRARRRTGVGARRRTRRGRGMLALGYGGALGGNFTGVSMDELKNLYDAAAAANEQVVKIPKWVRDYEDDENINPLGKPWMRKVKRPVIDPNTNTQEVIEYDIDKAKKMLDNYERMKNFWLFQNYDPNTNTWSNPRTPAEVAAFRKQYIKDHRGEKFRPWTNISKKRMYKMERAYKRSTPKANYVYSGKWRADMDDPDNTGSYFRKWTWDGKLKDNEWYHFNTFFRRKRKALLNRIRHRRNYPYGDYDSEVDWLKAKIDKKVNGQLRGMIQEKLKLGANIDPSVDAAWTAMAQELQDLNDQVAAATNGNQIRDLDENINRILRESKRIQPYKSANK